MKTCVVNVPKIDITQYLSSKTSQEVSQIFDYVRMCCIGFKNEVQEFDQGQSTEGEPCSINSPRTKYFSALGLKPVTLNPAKIRRASKRLRLAGEKNKSVFPKDTRDEPSVLPDNTNTSVVSVSRTVREETPSKRVHFSANPVSDSMEIPRRPDGRHTRQSVKLSGYDQQMFVSKSVREKDILVRSDQLEGENLMDIVVLESLGKLAGNEDMEIDPYQKFTDARSSNCSPIVSSDSGIEDAKGSGEDAQEEYNVLLERIRKLEHKYKELLSLGPVDLPKNQSVHTPLKYTDSDLNETKEVSENREEDDGAIATVTDYGSFMVTRTSSMSYSSNSEDREELPFEAYKKKMQTKLRNNQNDSICNIDLDSDSDVSDDWQPSRTEEELDKSESDEEDDFKPSKVSLEGLIDKYKCETCDKVYQKSGHWIKHMRECSTEVQAMLENTEQHSNLQCTHCHATFATPGSLQRHLVNMHALGSKPGIYETNELIIEVKPKDTDQKHKPETELAVCKLCGRRFVKGGHLINHMKTVHKTPETLENPTLNQSPTKLKNHCDQCQRTFFNFPSFRRHMKLHGRTIVKSESVSLKTTIKKTYACKLCDKSFYTRPSLTRHTRTDHQGFKSKCTICGETVARLDNHMSQVHAVKLAPCPVCKKLLASSSISRHVRTVHMGCMVRCVECDKFVSNLHKHMWHEHTTAAQIRKEGHREHKDCDCVFFLGPSAHFVPQHTVEIE